MHPILKMAGLGALAFFLSGCKVSDILTGYVANTMCTKVFVSGLPEDHIIETDLEPNTLGLLAITKITVDYSEKAVVASADQFRSVW